MKIFHNMTLHLIPQAWSWSSIALVLEPARQLIRYDPVIDPGAEDFIGVGDVVCR